jgi:ketosteroid isomerase-like protein
MAHVWTFRDGKTVRLRQFLDRVKALKAAGLSEQDL